jgi:hypothetical protein
MAATTTAFETEILAFAPTERGFCAAPAYRLRQAYLAGVTDPTAHTIALIDSASVDALARNAKTASFAAITAP